MSDVEKNIGTHKPEFDGEWVPISQVYDLQMGKTPSRDVPEYWNNGDHNWVSIKDLGSYGKYVGKTSETISERGRKESGIKAVPADTLLMSFKLSLGKASITTEETFTNEAIMAFLDKGAYEVDIDYMWYQLRSKDWSAGSNTAVMGKTLNKKTLGSTLIRVPPIAKQREVARRLDSAENVLSLLGREKNTLDDLVKSKFVEMFGDLVGNVGGWDVATLGSVCEIITGNTPPRSEAANYGDYLEWCKTDNITNGKYLTPAAEMLSEAGAEKARSVPPGSILMACIAGSINSIGKVAIADRRVSFNQQINAIIPGEKLNLDYLYWMLRLSKEYLCTGVNMQLKGILNKSTLSEKEFPIPALARQQEFADFVAEVDKLRFDVQQQIEKLETLKQSLMQEYFG